MRLGRTTGTIALTLAPTSSVHASLAADPPRLVRWHLIGNIGIGMTDTRVEYTYGYPIDGSSDNGLDFRLYRGRGRIGTAYDRRGRVVWVSTDSPIYRTADGFGVGSAIPLGKCHLIKGKCVYRWNGFTLVYGEGGTHVWVGTFGGFHVRLEMTKDRVRSIGMYVQRAHVCYPFYITCDGVR
jgi:hypothetical protein